MDSDDEQLLRGRIYGADHDHPGPKPGRRYAELVGGPLDGLLLDITGWRPEEIDDGVSLLTKLGQLGPGGRALYDPRPGDPARWDWGGDSPDGPPLGRVKTPLLRNLLGRPGVVPDMNPINEAHVSRPGLVVVDVAAADDATALSFQQLLADRWATATAERTTHDVGQPGVRLRCYLDLQQPVDSDAPADAPPLALAEVQQ